MIKLRRYEPKDYPLLVEWWQAYACNPMSERMIPEIGFVAENEYGAVAACFLLLTDSSLALLEGAIGNPAFGSGERSQAVDLLTMRLIREGRSRGKKDFIVITKHPRIAAKEKLHKFKRMDEGLSVYLLQEN